MEEKESKNK